MENILLQYLDREATTPLEKSACQDTIHLLKSKVRNVLSLNDSRCILINAYCIDQCNKTIIMIECQQSEKMRIYSIDKHPSDVTKEDIELLEYKPYRPCVRRISVA